MTGLPSFAAMVRAYPNDADPNDVFKLVGVGKFRPTTTPIAASFGSAAR